MKNAGESVSSKGILNLFYREGKGREGKRREGKGRGGKVSFNRLACYLDLSFLENLSNSQIETRRE